MISLMYVGNQINAGLLYRCIDYVNIAPRLFLWSKEKLF